MPMLRHTEGLRQIYDKMRFAKNCTRKLRKSYEKTWWFISCHTTISSMQ